MTTRRSLLQAGLGSIAAATLGTPITARAAPALQNVHIVIPAESVFVLNYLGAKDAGVFAKYGIDLSADPRPFAGFLAGLPSKQCLVDTYSGIDAIQKINEGLDWVILGPGLTVVQDVIVRKDSPFKSPADLRGKKFGVFSTGAGSFKCARAAMIDAFKIDIVKDTSLQQVAGPALTKLLEDGQVDAMINISSLNLTAEAQTDKLRVLFSPNDYWKKKTGYPITWAAPVVAWRSWVNEDQTRAKNFAAAVEASFRWLEKPENLDAAVKSHGALAGVTAPDVVAEYKTWLQSKDMFMTDWSRKAADAEWQFLEVCQKTGILDKVPDQNQYALFVES
jgi:ABC-type nitrate/sulfonate/bicarbonate transport system substrate-binding protein